MVDEHLTVGGQGAARATSGALPFGLVFNRSTGFAFFAPITTVGNASRGTGFAVSLTGAGTSTTGVIQIDQVRSFDWRDRGGRRSGDTVPASIMTEKLERFAPIFGLGVLEADD
jgi:mRNA-degrading endonuclease toxin of MazEF toxin-antitoxin module